MGTATKAGIVAKDIVLGQGTVEQTRGGVTATEDKINAGVIPYIGEEGDVDYESIKDRLDTIDPDIVAQNTLDIAQNVSDISDNATNIDLNTEAIANLATAQGSIENDTTPAIAAIPTVTPDILSFDEVTASTDTNVFTIDDTTETILFSQDASFNFSSSVKFTSSTASVVTVSFDIVDISDDAVLGTTEVVLNTAIGQSTTVPLNTLITVGKNGIPPAPLTIRIEVSADIAGYSVDSFNSVLASSSSYDVTTEASGINYDNTTSELAGENVQDAIDEIVAKGSPSEVITNGAVTSGALALATIEVAGSVPILYAGNGTTKDVPTPMQVANDNGDGTTLAADWVAGTFAVDDIAMDNTPTGDARAYRCLIAVTVADTDSPVIDTTNWVLETNQYGGRFHFKNRDAADDHKVFDSIRRELNNIETNTTAIEASLANSLTAIGVNTLTIGSDVTVNTNTENYVVWVDQTTRKTAGYRTDAGVMQNSKNNTGTDLMATDNASNPIIEHYNPTTGLSIIMDTGNGVAGRTIPHSLQNLLGTNTRKKITGAVNGWIGYDKIGGATHYMRLNETSASTASTTTFNDTVPTEDNFTVGSLAAANESAEQFISYLQADSANHVTKSYNGSGAVGNVVDLGLDMTVAGSRVEFVKRLDSTGNWITLDNVRSASNNPINDNLLLDSSAAESVDDANTNFEFTTTGIIINSTNVGNNGVGGQYLIQAYSPKYAQPTDGNLIGVNSSIDLTYTQGIGNTNLQETTLAHTVDVSGFNGNPAYLLKERGSDAVGFAQELGVGQSRIDADRWGTTNGDYKTTDRHGSPESTTGFVSAEKAYLVGYEPYKAFNKVEASTNSGWISNNLTDKILYELTEPRELTSYRIKVGLYSDDLDRTAKDWTVEGSNDSYTWSTVDTVSGFVPTALGEWSPLYTADSPNLYEKYRLNITLNNGDVTYLTIGEIEFNFEISAKPYINTLDKLVYDSLDVAIDLVALGECKVDTQGNAFDLIEYEPLEVYFNGATFTGEVNLKANIKIVDFGVVFNDQRIVMDNPFGNENYVGCITRAEVFFNGIWSETKMSNTNTSSSGYGALSSSNIDGIVVQSGGLGVLINSNISGGGHGIRVPQASAPCRVIVTKISKEVKDA